jgi:hypothetical protein
MSMLDTTRPLLLLLLLLLLMGPPPLLLRTPAAAAAAVAATVASAGCSLNTRPAPRETEAMVGRGPRLLSLSVCEPTDCWPSL